MEQHAGPDPASAQAKSMSPSDAAPPALDDDDDVIDAEITDVPLPVLSDSGIPPAADYDEAGVPSLDYLRERIESRYGIARATLELAEAAAEPETVGPAASRQQAAQIADRRTALDQAGRERLEEIKRLLRP